MCVLLSIFHFYFFDKNFVKLLINNVETHCVLLFRLIGLIGQRSNFDQQRFWISYRRGITSWSREPLHLDMIL